MGRTSTAIAVAAVCLTTCAHASEISSFSVGSWSGGAYAGETTRQFTHCAVSAEYRNDVSLIFGLDRDRGLFLGLSNRGWSLAPKKTVEVGIMIDGAVVGRFSGNPVDAILLFVDLDHSAGIERSLRGGNTLRIAAAAESLYFDLSGLPKALDALRHCVDDNLSTAERSHPPR